MLIINFHAKIQQQRLILQLFSEKTQDTKELYTKMSIFYSSRDCALSSLKQESTVSKKLKRETGVK